MESNAMTIAVLVHAQARGSRNHETLEIIEGHKRCVWLGDLENDLERKREKGKGVKLGEM